MSHDSTRFLGRTAVAVCSITFVALAALPFSAQGQKPSQPPNAEVVTTLPKGPMAEKAATACTECHEARIILQQRLGKAAWTREVDKMMKWGAVVEPSDRDALIDYLSTNFSPDKPPYEAPRTGPDKSTPRKTAK